MIPASPKRPKRATIENAMSDSTKTMMKKFIARLRELEIYGSPPEGVPADPGTGR